MTKKANAVNNAKSDAQNNGHVQTAPTVTNAQQLTEEQLVKVQFDWKVEGFTDLLKSLIKGDDSERKQLARFINACCDRFEIAILDMYEDNLRTRNFKNYAKRERAVRCAVLEQMGQLIERKNDQ